MSKTLKFLLFSTMGSLESDIEVVNLSHLVDDTMRNDDNNSAAKRMVEEEQTSPLHHSVSR